MVWANVGHGYHTFWETPASIRVGSLALELTLHGWVDEGLMAAFFFMVGLDVRREISLGDLRLPGRALLPAAAAIAGLVVPTVIYLLVAGRGPGAHAWGTVISTDTAFAVGMLALVGPRRAPRLRIFLLAFAVIDDILALLVIAVFYTSSLNLTALVLAGLGLVGVWLLQRAGVWQVVPYAVLAALIWYAVHASGVHASIAGVLVALLMPVRHVRPADLDRTHEVYRLFRQAPAPGSALVMQDVLAYSMPLNQRLSFVLPPYLNFAVVPIFALANAGVVLSGDSLAAAFGSSITWGVVAGLVLGKPLGVILGAGVVMWLVPSSRLPGMDMPRIAGAGALSGIGFTISLLVASIAFDPGALADQARVGILVASALALGLAALTFRIGDRLWPLPPPLGETLARPPDDHHDHLVGSPDAPVALVNYADMSYESRWRLMEALQEVSDLVAQGHLRMYLRHKAYSPDSLTAALALEAADQQGRIWEMHDALALRRGDVDEEAVLEVARGIGLDVEALRRRMASGVDVKKVEDDSLDVLGLEEDGGPVVYLNGKRMHGLINRWTIGEKVAALLDQGARQ